MKKSHLDLMLQGISDALIKANNQIREQYIQSLADYFDETGNPIMIDFYVPNVDDSKDSMKVSLPKLTLIPPRLMMIKEVLLDFNIPLSQIYGSDDDTNSTQGSENIAKSSNDINSDNEQVVQIQITIKDYETPEGVILINEKLHKVIP